MERSGNIMKKQKKYYFLIMFGVIALSYLYLMIFNLGYQAGKNKALHENSTVLIKK
jgi:hypothetical protein